VNSAAASQPPERSEPGILYLEASADGQIEKVFGDRSWLPFDVRAYATTLGAVFPALDGLQSAARLELDFVEIEPDLFVDIQYQSDGGRQFVWLRNTSRHAAHLRAAQQHSNSTALRNAISARWLDDIHREHSHIRLLLDGIPLPIAYWSMGGTLDYCNPTFCAACGDIPAAQLRGVSADSSVLGAMRLPLATIESVGRARIEVLRTGVAHHSHLIPDLSPTGEVAGFLDVTAQKSPFQ
jgi:PAS domain-containing protein